MPSISAATGTVLELAAALAEGRTSSRALVEEALARIADPAGEGARLSQVYEQRARCRRRAGQAASRRLRRLAARGPSGLDQGPVRRRGRAHPRGLEGARRRAAGGARRRHRRPAEAPPARCWSGRTNMTEFAFSGVGINPHYGTPGNPFDRARIPGGSSSGAAVAVQDGLCVVAIGTDTGGSVRIPAALCGLVGFKPTQRRVPRDGALPLSTTLDSVGPLGPQRRLLRHRRCRARGRGAGVAAGDRRPRGCGSACRRRVVLDDLDEPVAAPSRARCTTLSRAGARITDLPLAELGRVRRDQRDRRLLRRPRPMPGIALCWRGAAPTTTRGSASASSAAAP